MGGKAAVSPNMFEYPLDLVCDWHRAVHHHVGVGASWPDVALSHLSDGGSKLFQDRLGGSAALFHVAFAPSFEADVVGHVDVDSSSQIMP